MIAMLRGKIAEKEIGFIVIDVGGVGYKTFCTKHTIESLREGSEVSVWTHLVVRDDALDLYGFADKTELSFFKLLISVSGIGPKSALGTLNASSVEMLTKAISSGDTSHLTKVSGIGKKSAERIVIELRDKIGDVLIGGTDVKEEIDAVEALRSLGYSQQESREALKKISGTGGKTRDLIKEALKILGNQNI